MTLSSFHDQLAAIVGSPNLIVDPIEASTYTVGARGEKGTAAFVVRPATTAEVSAVVGLCVSENVSIIPQGANTGLVDGSVPDDSGTQGVISLDRLRRPIEIDIANRSVTVGAGVRLSQLNAALRTHGYHFPIDLGSDPSIGGMVATNTGGSRFVRYGDVRDHVLGLEVVLPNRSGTVLGLLSKVRKNNIGFDTAQLFIGTSGRFGIVTQAVLDVARLPGQTAAAILVPSSGERIIDLLLSLEERFDSELSAFEGMSRNAMSCALATVRNLHNPFGADDIPPYALLVELSRASRQGKDASLEEHLQQCLASLLERPGSPLANAYFGPLEAMWSLRHSLTEGLKASGKVIAFDLAFPRQNVFAFRREIGELTTREYPELRLCDFGHVADGGVHFNFIQPTNGGTPLSQTRIDEFRSFIVEKAVRDYQGSFSAEHGIGRSNVGFYRRFAGWESVEITNGLDDLVRRLSPLSSCRPSSEGCPI